jgi:hypothetical protein
LLIFVLVIIIAVTALLFWAYNLEVITNTAANSNRYKQKYQCAVASSAVC